MIGFINEILYVYHTYIQFLFDFKLSGISVGYFILAVMIIGLVIHYLMGRVK